ncbi:MAG: 1-phosphofructokinase family hexose kinase [Oscillochloridaceae bacterium umkhey_bin13]
MLLIITPNPALDRTMVLPGLRLGEANRTGEVLVTAGGKGLNVARAARALGQQAMVCAPLGGHIGEYVSHLAASEGLLGRWTSHRGGETRTCVLLVDPQAEDATALNEQGPILSATDWQTFTAEVLTAAASADLSLLAGSLPLGVEAHQLADLVVDLNSRGQRVLVDTSGPALATALAARPYGVKVNAAELGWVFGHRIESISDAAEALERLRSRGISLAVVSLGARGCVAADVTGVWHARPPQVRVVSTIGSGDALHAGLATGLLRGLPLADALRFGVACGTANTLTIGAGQINAAEVDRLQAEVTVTPIS